MSGNARHRGGWLPVFLFTTFCVLVVEGGAAMPAVGGGHAGGHVGGFTGSGHPGGNFSRGRQFGGGCFEGRGFRHGHGGPGVFVFPNFYDPYYAYDAYYGYPYAPYCDPYSPSYTPQYCYYWDYGP